MGDALATAAVALGSNLEPRFDHLQQAIIALARHPRITTLKVARVYVAPAVPVPGVHVAVGDDYLNTAITFQTPLSPLALLEALKVIERALGRDPTLHPHGGPRPIDLDLILLGQHQLHTPRLTLPHPRLSQRVFVLQPLCDLLPFMQIPTERRTLRQALEAALIASDQSLLQPYSQALTIPA